MSDSPLGRWMFGKIPTHGDFISRGLTLEIQHRLDSWLCEEMERARTIHGQEFDSRYDNSPAWAFVGKDALAGWYAGALCASCDAVGRRFPIMLAEPTDGLIGAAGLAAGIVEQLCLGFSEGWAVDEFEGRPAQVATACGWSPSEPEWALLASDGPAMILPGLFPENVIVRMMEWAQ